MLFLTLIAGAFAYNATTTVESTAYLTTYCSEPTTLTYGNATYTVSEATTLTIEDCSCTETGSVAAEATAANSTVAGLSNGAAAGKVAAAAGVAAAVAYIL